MNPSPAPPPPSHDKDEVDLSEESVAGEEDPGAALDEDSLPVKTPPARPPTGH